MTKHTERLLHVKPLHWALCLPTVFPKGRKLPIGHRTWGRRSRKGLPWTAYPDAVAPSLPASFLGPTSHATHVAGSPALSCQWEGLCQPSRGVSLTTRRGRRSGKLGMGSGRTSGGDPVPHPELPGFLAETVGLPPKKTPNPRILRIKDPALSPRSSPGTSP